MAASRAASRIVMRASCASRSRSRARQSRTNSVLVITLRRLWRPCIQKRRVAPRGPNVTPFGASMPARVSRSVTEDEPKRAGHAAARRPEERQRRRARAAGSARLRRAAASRRALSSRRARVSHAAADRAGARSLRAARGAGHARLRVPLAFLRRRGASDAADPRRSRTAPSQPEARRRRGAGSARERAGLRAGAERRSRRDGRSIDGARCGRRAQIPCHRAAVLRRPERGRNSPGVERLDRHHRPGAAARRSLAAPRAVTRRMTPERWQAIGDLFDRASVLPAGDQTAFADAHCSADDEEMRVEVASLLASHRAAAGGFLQDRIKGALTAFFDTSVTSGARVGPYRLIRELGRGGMGTVFLAERDDDEYRARVAVKLVRPGMDTEFILARFRRERQTLA